MRYDIKIMYEFYSFLIICICYFSVVSSDADNMMLGKQILIPTKEVHKQHQVMSSIDSMWEDVVEAAFASPMEWIQLRRALDKAGANTEDLKWIKNTNIENQHSQDPQLYYPEKKFKFHKVYLTNMNGKIIDSTTSTTRDKMGITAIAAMTVSTDDDNDGDRSLSPPPHKILIHNNNNKKKENNLNFISSSSSSTLSSSSSSSSSSPLFQNLKDDSFEKKLDRSSTKFKGKTNLEKEFIQSLKKHRQIIESKKDFHWRPWIHASSIVSMNDDDEDMIVDDASFEMDLQNNNNNNKNEKNEYQEKDHVSWKNHLKFQQPKILFEEEQQDDEDEEDKLWNFEQEKNNNNNHHHHHHHNLHSSSSSSNRRHRKKHFEDEDIGEIDRLL